MKEITVTLSRKAYELLLNGWNDEETKSSRPGLKTKENVIAYVDKTWGLLGTVTNIHITDG